MRATHEDGRKGVVMDSKDNSIGKVHKVRFDGETSGVWIQASKLKIGKSRKKAQRKVGCYVRL
jgi:hypothetical protein